MKISFVAVCMLAAALVGGSARAAQAVASDAASSNEASWWSRGVQLEKKAADNTWTVRWFDDLTVHGTPKSYAGNPQDEPWVEITALRSADEAGDARSIVVRCLGTYARRVVVAAVVVQASDIEPKWMQQFRCGGGEWRVRTINVGKLPSATH
ncbi:hypothetical protein [Paraburkholderia unamae]|uniref:Secreted protein n=1 Tax=Paraburkholderia unamae TaxID=219649 RepID=A0ABX5KLP9_9BURK|nr:hypothetical protein [Paraburkholderia unamae]PVX81765.1 hypothetical protein C7402_110169 [Paraburkholderia unamae]